MAVDLLRKYEKLDAKEIKDEKKRIRSLIETGAYPQKFDMPLLLQFELTSRCNVYCKHCYNNSGENIGADAMTPDRWIDFCREIVAYGGIFECIISGGEPLLLGEKLFDIMNILHDDGTIFLLITNGFLLDRKTVDRLSKYNYRWIQVSIDGATAEYHDAFRQRTGSWEKAVNGAIMVSNAGIPLTVAHSVSPQNLGQIDEMCDLAYSLGAASIILGEINLSGRTAKHKELLLNNDQRRIFLQKYEENLAKYAGKMLVQRSASTKHSTSRYLDTPNTGLIVRPNGDLRLDCMVPFVIGNVLSGSFVKLWKAKGIRCWENPKVLEYMAQFKTPEYNTMATNYVDCDFFI